MNMTKDQLWRKFERMFEDGKIKLEDLFNYFSSNELQDFYEFLQDEGY